MKKLLYAPLTALALTMFLSCNRMGRPLDDLIGGVSAKSMGILVPGSSRFIPADTANRMIKSYLNGINYRNNTGEIRSWTLNADTLRSFLKDNKIVALKLMLAHNREYILSGHEGQLPAQNTAALTVIIAGVDPGGDFVYHADNEVLNRCQPCPTECIGNGTASADTLVIKK